MKTTVVLALCAIAAFAVAARVGGFSDVKPVDESVQVVFESAEGMAAVGKAFGLNVYSLRVVAYRTQVVSARVAAAPCAPKRVLLNCSGDVVCVLWVLAGRGCELPRGGTPLLRV
jgi:hypothetical protein